MLFLIRPYRRFPLQRPVTYNTGPFQGQSTVWILSWTDWRLSDDQRWCRKFGQVDKW